MEIIKINVFKLQNDYMVKQFIPIYKKSFSEPLRLHAGAKHKWNPGRLWEKKAHVPSASRKAKYCTYSGSGKSTYCYIPAHQNFPGMCLVPWSKANVIFLPSKSCFFIGLLAMFIMEIIASCPRIVRLFSFFIQMEKPSSFSRILQI